MSDPRITRMLDAEIEARTSFGLEREKLIKELKVTVQIAATLRASCLAVYRRHDDEIESDEWDLFEAALFAALQLEVDRA